MPAQKPGVSKAVLREAVIMQMTYLVHWLFIMEMKRVYVVSQTRTAAEHTLGTLLRIKSCIGFYRAMIRIHKQNLN